MVPTEAVLMAAGLQVPAIPSEDAAGNAGAVAFWQSGPMRAKVGVMLDATTMFILAVEAHCPKSGVKLYTEVPMIAVLMVKGFHVPVIPFADAAGKGGATEFWQRVPIGLKTGVMLLVTVMSIVTGTAHWPAYGVKV